jgi:hypothetical protein
MTKQLYEEALADVKKLKEVAEDNAKKALIEAVAPRIKDLIEAELLREVDSNHSDKAENPVDDGLLMDDMDGYPLGKPSEGPAMSANLGPAPSVTLDLSSLSDFSSLQDEEMYTMSDSDVDPLDQQAPADDLSRDQLDERIVNLKKKISRVSESISNAKNTSFHKLLVAEMVSNVEGLYQSLQESAVVDNKLMYENVLEKMYKDLNKLTERTMIKNRLHEKSMSVTFDNLPEELSDDDLENVQVKMTLADDDSDEADEEQPDDSSPLDLDSPEEDEAEEPAGDEESDEKDEEPETPALKEGRRGMNVARLSDNTIVEIDEGMLRREITKMKALREAADDVQSWGHGAGDLGDLEDQDLGDPLDMDLGDDDLTESAEMDEAVVEIVADGEADVNEGTDDDSMNEMNLDEEGDDLSELSQAEDGNQYGGNGDGGPNAQTQMRQTETIRRRLAAEQRLQLEARKKAAKAASVKKSAAKKAAAKQAAAKKAKAAGENKKAAQLKEAAIQDHQEYLRASKAYDVLATKFNESVHRAARLRSMLTEVDSRNGSKLNGGSTRSAEGTEILRNKLAETNLFNTKLLYTNKLLQNESLTKRQKADVIERLDEAKTEREVKLVYESLVKTLTNRSSNLSEGASRVVGSSSAPTRSASTVLNEGFEADRWAKLAGIK